MTTPQLGSIISVEDAPGLAMQIASLSSADLGTRVAAESSLKTDTDAQIIPTLARLLNDPAQPLEARWRAAIILGDRTESDHRDAVIAALLNALGDEAWEVRHSVVYALSHLHVAQAYDGLRAEVMKAYKDEQIPFVAGLGMIQIDPAQAQTDLEAAAAHDDPAIYSVARSVFAAIASRTN